MVSERARGPLVTATGERIDDALTLCDQLRHVGARLEADGCGGQSRLVSEAAAEIEYWVCRALWHEVRCIDLMVDAIRGRREGRDDG